MIDEKFIYRTYRTTLIVWLITVFAILSFQKWFAALGFTIGTIVSLGILASISYMVKNTFVPAATGTGIKRLKFGILKYFIIVLIITGIVFVKNWELIIGFLGGIGLAQLVMFLKAIGITLNERMGQ